MKQKRHTTEEIIRIFREADQGKDPQTVCRFAQRLGGELLSLEEEIRRQEVERRP